MKYASPKYERTELFVSDILMSGENYTIEENKDENSSAIGPFEINLSLDETINVGQFYESSISAKQK